MTSQFGSDVIFEIFGGYFGENLSKSISTPKFLMIELETTKLGGEAYCSVFNIAQMSKI